MESNEQTELTRKMGTDSYTESRLTAGGGGVSGEGWRDQAERKKNSLTRTTDSVVIAGRRGIRGQNVIGKIQ